MFGFSITKLIFTVVVVFAVWQAFKYFNRLQDTREKRARMHDKAAKSQNDAPPPPGVEDMVQCSVCGSFVARGSQPCGQEGCPFKG